MDGLTIHLLGAFRVFVDDEEIDSTRLPRRTARLVLKLLALAPGRKLHREQLLDALSAGADEDPSLNRLHKAIHVTRRALEPNLERVAQSRFLLTQDTLVLLADARIDIDQFERTALDALRNPDPAALEQALALYTGDLLEEDLYEEWAAAPRERLRLLHQRTLSALNAAYESTGDPRTLESVQRLLAAFPADEEGHRRLMRVYAAYGRRHLALEQFKTCCEALDTHLNASPEKATVDLYESILAGAWPTTSVPAAAPVAAAPAPPPVASPTPNRRRTLSLTAIAAAAILTTALGVYALRHRATATPRGPVSLAILPHRSPAPAAESLADGLTEGLINSASRLPGLKVMARTTAFSFKGRSDGWQIGRELNVNYVLFGAVDQHSDQVTVKVELVDVADGSRAWGRQYSVAARETPAIENLINTELAAALKVKPSNLAPERTTSNPQAYSLYWQGRQLWNQRTLPGFQRSIELYRQAIALDSSYALAYAGLADSYGLIGFRDGQPSEYFPRALDAATRALELDPSLAEAQTSLAMVNALYSWNWPAAEAQFRRAIDMNPGYVTAHHWLGVHLAAQGRLDDARAELEKARALDPRSAIVTLNSGYPALYQRNYDEALTIFKYALTLRPGFGPAREDLVTVYDRLRLPDQAAREWIDWLRGEGRTALADQLAPLAASRDYAAVIQKSLDSLENPPSQDYQTPMLPALAAIRLGDSDKAFRWLNRAVEQHCPQLVYLNVDPRYDPLRADSRFPALLKAVGLTTRR